jgi:hypothetical protein
MVLLVSFIRYAEYSASLLFLQLVDTVEAIGEAVADGVDSPVGVVFPAVDSQEVADSQEAEALQADGNFII